MYRHMYIYIYIYSRADKCLHLIFQANNLNCFICYYFDNFSLSSFYYQVGHTKVTFLEPRILFSNSPQGLTTWRKAILHNIGQNHAYFKVMQNSCLFLFGSNYRMIWINLFQIYCKGNTLLFWNWFKAVSKLL